MNASSPEFVAGRVVAVFVVERLVRSRTALVVWGVAAVAAVLTIGAVASDGLGAVIVGLFAFLTTVVALTLFAVRSVVLRGIRRVGGGRDYARLRPIVARHIAEVERAGAVIPLDPPSAIRFAWRARRPRALQEHLRATAETVAHAVPGVVADVRREMGGHTIETSSR